MAKRVEKVNSLFLREIGQILLKEFNFSGVLATITRVSVTPNLIEARVYVSIFPEEKSEFVLKVLSGNIYEIQQKINKKLNMRPIPKIIFLKENQIAEASKIEKILNKLRNNSSAAN